MRILIDSSNLIALAKIGELHNPGAPPWTAACSNIGGRPGKCRSEGESTVEE